MVDAFHEKPIFPFFKKKKPPQYFNSPKKKQPKRALLYLQFLNFSSRSSLPDGPRASPVLSPPPVSNVFYALTFAAACTGPRRRALAPRCHLPPRSVGSVFHWIISCACGSCEALWTRLGVSSPLSPFFLATHLLRRAKGVFFLWKMS